jgi:hypothetical protein
MCGHKRLYPRRVRLGKLLILLLIIASSPGCTYYFGSSWFKKAPAYRNSDPMPFSTELRERTEKTNYQKHPLIQHWADKNLRGWSIKDKSGTPRVMLAKLALKQDIQRVNEFLLVSEPWGISGSTSPYFKKGDYDFTQIILCSVLHLFGEDKAVLWPKTRDHLLNVLLLEEGGEPNLKSPRTMRIMRDTENHILMTEITRYLKNQWLKNHGSKEEKHDNSRNGLEKWFRAHLKEMLRTGMYEFNARPYMGYTLSALLTLHAFAESDELVHLSQKILDHMNYTYAMSSMDYRRSVPFRRRLAREKNTDIFNDPHSAMMKAWVKKFKGEAVKPTDMDYGKHQALMALLLSYQLPEKVVELAENTTGEYLLRIGHGHKASPEIHSRGGGFLLSAGGVQRGKTSQIVARPTVLILDDGAMDYQNCFYLTGKGKMRKWNNTGVYHRFACAERPVYIPEKYSPSLEQGGWKIFKPYSDRNFFIAIYNRKKLGLLLIFPEWEAGAQNLVEELQKENPDEDLLKEEVHFPDGLKIQYDIKAPKGKWVIKSSNTLHADRDYDDWARLQLKRFD